MLLRTHLSAIASMLQITFNNTFWIILTLCSQVSFQYTSKYTPSTFPGTPLSTFWSIHQITLSRMLLIALNGTLAAICTPLYTLIMLLSPLPSMLTSMSPTALHDTLSAYLALCFQVYFQQARYSQFHLTICSHVCFLVLDSETCRVAATRHQKADGR